MEGYSVLNAASFLAFASWSVINPSKGRFRRTESAFALIILASLVLPLIGYDLRVGWPFLEEGAFIAGLLVVVTAIVRWGRRELAEGEYDEPYEAP